MKFSVLNSIAVKYMTATKLIYQNTCTRKCISETKLFYRNCIKDFWAKSVYYKIINYKNNKLDKHVL